MHRFKSCHLDHTKSPENQGFPGFANLQVHTEVHVWNLENLLIHKKEINGETWQTFCLKYLSYDYDWYVIVVIFGVVLLDQLEESLCSKKHKDYLRSWKRLIHIQRVFHLIRYLEITSILRIISYFLGIIVLHLLRVSPK